MPERPDEWVADLDLDDARQGKKDDEAYRRPLYQLLSDPTTDEQILLERLLALGRHYLGVENGHLVEIEERAGRHEVVAANGSDVVEEGDRTDLSKTYCRKTIQQDELLTVFDAEATGWGDDPAYQLWELGCYIGTRLIVQGDTYGTVCFVDREPREEPFSDADRTFVDLLNWAVSQVLERQRYEKTIHRIEELFELFVEEVSDHAIFMLDRVGRVATWNQGARLLKGYEKEEIVGEHFARFYPAADREEGKPAKLLEKARETGRAEDEGWRVRADGSRFWALVSITALYDEGELRGFGKVTRDLTERRKAERQLAAEKAFTERALNTLEDLFFVMDVDGYLQRVNDPVVAVTGYSRDAITSMRPSELFAPEDRETIQASLEEVLETGEVTVEGMLVTAEGERRRYEFRARRLADADGKLTGIVGTGRDITDQRTYEQRLEVAQRVLRHNLRNDLNVIRGWAETLDETATDAQQDAVEHIIDTTNRLVTLTEKSRILTGMESLSVDSTASADVAETVRRILEKVTANYPEATVETELPAAMEMRLAGDERFRLALGNAVENALEHNPADEPWVKVVVEEDDDVIRVAVYDDGPEIPGIERRALGKSSEEPGEEPLEHGSGIGLWLIHWCVRTLGGEVTFEDREPTGTVLRMTFPTAATD